MKFSFLFSSNSSYVFHKTSVKDNPCPLQQTRDQTEERRHRHRQRHKHVRPVEFTTKAAVRLATQTTQPKAVAHVLLGDAMDTVREHLGTLRVSNAGTRSVATKDRDTEMDIFGKKNNKTKQHMLENAPHQHMFMCVQSWPCHTSQPSSTETSIVD